MIRRLWKSFEFWLSEPLPGPAFVWQAFVGLVVAGLCIALLLTISPAYAQFTKSTLNSQVTSNFPDNTTGAITPAITRTFFNNIISSYQQAPQVNAQTGASYAFVVGDFGNLVTFNNAGAVAVTLPQATGSFASWSVFVRNIGAGAVTITPATSTINGASTLAVNQNGFVLIVSDGTNYQTYGIPNSLSGSFLSANSVTNSALAQMSANGLKGNNTGAASNVLDLTPGQVGGILCTPNTQIFTSGSSQTYTTPSCNSVAATWLEVHVQGGGGAGGGSGTTATSASNGNASSFGALSAGGGGGGTNAGTNGEVGAGGTCSGSLGTQQNFTGSAGAAVTNAASTAGGYGGASYYGGAGANGVNGAVGQAAPTNSGGGGGGAGMGAAGAGPGAGGGAGCHIWSIITSPAATITYTVGGTAAGGGAGTNGFAGGQGAAGLITVVAHWQ